MATQTINLGTTQVYFDRLEKEKSDAERKLNEAAMKEAGYQRNYEDAKRWREALSEYRDNIFNTFTLAQHAKDQLSDMKDKADCVQKNLNWTSDSVEKLGALVKATAMEINKLYQMDKKLMDKIDCLNSPILTSNPSDTTIMGELIKLKTRINDALSSMLAVIAPTLNVVKKINALTLSVGGVPKTDDTVVVSGIIPHLEEMIKLLTDGDKSYWQPLQWTFPDSDCGDPPPPPPECSIPIPCLMIDQDIGTDPTAYPPVSTDPGGKKENGGCKNEYFENLLKKLEHAIAWESYWKELRDDARQKKNDAQFLHDAIATGLIAGKAAKSN